MLGIFSIVAFCGILWYSIKIENYGNFIIIY